LEVNRPAGEMVPPPSTVQVTAWVSVPSTRTVNCRLAPGAIVVCAGETTTPVTALRQWTPSRR
jgi:hypothetical protein